MTPSRRVTFSITAQPLAGFNPCSAHRKGRRSDHAVGQPDNPTGQHHRRLDASSVQGREREFSPAENDLTGPKALRWRNRSAYLIQTCRSCPVLALCRQQRIQLENTVGAPLGVMAGMLNTTEQEFPAHARHRRRHSAGRCGPPLEPPGRWPTGGQPWPGHPSAAHNGVVRRIDALTSAKFASIGITNPSGCRRELVASRGSRH